MKRWILNLLMLLSLVLGLNTSCIEPPLNLPDSQVAVEYTFLFQTALEIEGDTLEALPSSYEVRRYYLGDLADGKHTTAGADGFTVFSNKFRRSYQFGYYDILVWSNIDSEDGTQVLVVDDSDVDSVKATTTVSRGVLRSKAASSVVGLYNCPERFYSAYMQNAYISPNTEDYDYYDEKENLWVKELSDSLRPLVYTYNVIVRLHNNDGRITGVTGDAALSALASGTSVNTGHTQNTPCMVYFPVKMTAGEPVDSITGTLTTFGLCDMEGYHKGVSTVYEGSRTDLDNRLYVTLKFSNGAENTYDYVVTDQVRKQCRGGLIIIDIDCAQVTPPAPDEESTGNIFVPTVEDYEHVDYDILM